MQLDHLFCFVPSQAAAERAVEQLGLVETYRRQHSGQGTSNICCCFDNAFVEFLWLTNETEARSPMVSRMGLLERSQYKTLGTCPFGIAWRGDVTGTAPDLWTYAPSYLPVGMHIPVATTSDDHRLPLVFQSPGNSAPRDWPAERRGSLQQSKGYHAILRTTITLPAALIKNPGLKWLSDEELISIAASPGSDYRLTLDIGDAQGAVATRIDLPLTSPIHH